MALTGHLSYNVSYWKLQKYGQVVSQNFAWHVFLIFLAIRWELELATAPADSHIFRNPNSFFETPGPQPRLLGTRQKLQPAVYLIVSR
jgi:hypothetical protein